MTDVSFRHLIASPLKACPFCLDDLIQREDGNGVSYVCKSCETVEIRLGHRRPRRRRRQTRAGDNIV